MKKEKIIIVSGYFNPLHKGHIELFHNAKRGDKLFVIVNNDYQRELKGSNKFMNQEERLQLSMNCQLLIMLFFQLIMIKRFVRV